MRYSRILHTCLFCSAEFAVKKNQSARGNGKFCSRACKGAYRTRKAQEIHEQRFNMPIYDVLHHLYYMREMPIRAIAEMLGTSTRTLYNWIEVLNFPVRERSAAVALQWKDNEARRQATAERARENLKPYHGVPHPNIGAKISKGKLGRPVPALQGSRNPNWRGGKVDYRGHNWKSQRKKALERDKYQCKHCGKKDVPLQVHHKVPFRVSHDNSLRNLVSLCSACHAAAETIWKRSNPIEQRRLRLF